jgi:glycosyltransferase involved in cell wall biosynthesis
MNIVIDALPINHMSGRHVISGHLRMLAKYHGDRHQFFVLHHHNNRDLCCDLGSSFHWIECPNFGENWPARLWWQFTQLESLLTQLEAQLIISTSGALVPGTKLPQVVIAQNPWCYVREFHYTIGDRLKAWLQRQGYKQAQKKAQAMFFNSTYLGNLYLEQTGIQPNRSYILYNGIDDDFFENATEQSLAFKNRELTILTVSVMTPHKKIEEIISMLDIVIKQDLSVQLIIVGPWSNTSYKLQIKKLIQDFKLHNYVTITDKVSREKLQEFYQKSRVFCLFSRCESFGIPAIEAQTYGTPTIVADFCAPPEVAGPGGIIINSLNIIQETNKIIKLLTDSAEWELYSRNAFNNADRFRWNKVTLPLINFISEFSSHEKSNG